MAWGICAYCGTHGYLFRYWWDEGSEVKGCSHLCTTCRADLREKLRDLGVDNIRMVADPQPV